ncbi:MAG: T9SS type A sorting domain-containing protein [Nonlabens sp.]
MKNIIQFLFFCTVFIGHGQDVLDFDMDVDGGVIGGYATITYTISNISTSEIVTDLEISHDDAIRTTTIPSTTTINPGETITATNTLAISGDVLILNQGLEFAYTQASVQGNTQNGVVTELSDGIDLWGNPIEDLWSMYFAGRTDTFGVVYIDINGNGDYDVGVDNTVPFVEITVGNSVNNLIVTTNETGWYGYSGFPNGTLVMPETAVLDETTLPLPNRTYNIVDGRNPTEFNSILSLQDRIDFGYIDGNYGVIQASAFLDSNNSGVRDAGEQAFPGANFTLTANNNASTNSTINAGNLGEANFFDPNPGVQLNDITVDLGSLSPLFNVTTPDYDDVLSIANDTLFVPFAVVEVSSSNRDTSIDMVSGRLPNPGFESSLYIVVKNELVGASTGTLEFTKDPAATLVAVRNTSNGTDLLATGTASVTATGFTLNYSLTDFEAEIIRVTMDTPTSSMIGDVFSHSAIIIPSSTDSNSLNNTAQLDMVTVASYDPNDINEAREPRIPIDQFTSSDYLEYTIRFQNLGTAAAQFVRVTSQLNFMLDLDSFEMLSSSHDYTLTRSFNQEVEWLFEDIQLPAEQDDVAGSNGFIKYRVKPLPGYDVGDIIRAQAFIYFDYNAPVVTNEYMTTFDMAASINDQKVNASIYPNPLTETLLKTNLQNGRFTVHNLQGQQVKFGNFNNSQIEVELESGFYILTIESEEDKHRIKLIKK